MNYWHWIIPFILLILLFIWYFGIAFQYFVPPKIKEHKKAYWFTLAIFITLSILARTPATGFFVYFTLFHIVYDFIRIITYRFKKVNTIIRNLNYREIPIIFLSIIVTGYGLYNSMNPTINYHNIFLTKYVEQEIKIGFISDIHLGTPYITNKLEELKAKVNDENFDVFILGGDIFDEWTTNHEKELFFEFLKGIKTNYGIYFIEGNHDLLTDEIKKKYQEVNVKVLLDESILIDNRFYLVGRKDKSRKRWQEKNKSLEDLTKNLDKSLPIIILEHQPSTRKDLEEEQIDLSLSGHTHGGQIWPANYFVECGEYNYGNSKTIISSGYGTWGTPIRTAYESEFLSITIH